MPNQRDIYLAPFPFGDSHKEKQRPVLVISNSVFNANSLDVLVMAVTSNLNTPLASVGIDANQLETGTLPKPSMILPNKVYSVSQERVGKFFCRLKQAPFNEAIALLQETLDIS